MTQLSLFAEDKNPALSLYEFWDSVLKVMGLTAMAFGQRGWGIERNDNGTIDFGQQFRDSQTVYAHWTLAPDGRFKWGQMHGAYRRNMIAWHVPFLGWSWTHSRYQWLVSFDEAQKRRRYWKSFDLTDWREPRHYVSEDLLGCRTWRQTARWCQLERFDGEWRIMPSPSQSAPNDPWGPNTDGMARAEWAKYERLIKRRYLKAENKYLIANGLQPRVSARPPTVRSGGQVLPADQAVNRLLALLETEQPAKTTPLKRLKEAHNGIDHLASTNHV